MGTDISFEAAQARHPSRRAARPTSLRALPLERARCWAAGRGGEPSRAGGVTGSEYASKQPPDGYTLVLITGAYPVYPAMLKSMPSTR